MMVASGGSTLNDRVAKIDGATTRRRARSFHSALPMMLGGASEDRSSWPLLLRLDPAAAMLRLG
jgi:hypothetical protein